MICPDCRAEYKDHVKLCADCHVLLVKNDEAAGLPAAHEKNLVEDLDLVEVLSLNDLGLVGMAKSMLDEAGIPVMVRNEQLQDLFGIGRINFNPVSGDVDFYVNAEDEAAAREILSGICPETSPGS